jgi:hypothetical protein
MIYQEIDPDDFGRELSGQFKVHSLSASDGRSAPIMIGSFPFAKSYGVTVAGESSEVGLPQVARVLSGVGAGFRRRVGDRVFGSLHARMMVLAPGRRRVTLAESRVGLSFFGDLVATARPGTSVHYANFGFTDLTVTDKGKPRAPLPGSGTGIPMDLIVSFHSDDWVYVRYVWKCVLPEDFENSGIEPGDWNSDIPDVCYRCDGLAGLARLLDHHGMGPSA